MSARGACLACRARKVKCIPGPSQRCERCAARGLEDCVYKQIKKRGIGKTLRMGEACKRCRARKRKCDAKHPCTTCVEADKALECEYEIVVAQYRPSNHPEFVFWEEPGPAGSRDVSIQDRRAVGEMAPELPVKAHVHAPIIITQSELEKVPPARALIHSLSPNRPPFPIPHEPRPHTSSEVGTYNPPRITLPPFSVLFSFLFPEIPPEPHVPLSLLGAEGLQLSDATLGELDMKFRLRALCRLNKLGIRFSSQKQQALLRGDTSGTDIHPFFIHGAQSLGMHFYEYMDDSPALIRLQAKYVQKSLELLVATFGGRDWELIAHVALWVVAGSLVMRLSHVTYPYIKKCCEAVNVAGLQFVPTYGRPPEFSEDLHEKLATLSQIIYYENFWFLTCAGAEPTMTAGIEKEFRHRLQEVYPILFSICPLTMRTQTILLVRDTVVVLSIRPTDEIELGIWRQSCDRLVAALDKYSQTLLFNLRRFQELGDKGGAGVIRSSCVNCFAHLAVLCETVSRIEPTPHTELNGLCDSALERLGELAQDVCIGMEEYSRLDILLGLSWKRALGVFDARLPNVPLEHGAKLRRWKDVVAEVYSDLEAKLPDAEPGVTMQHMWSMVDTSTERINLYEHYLEG